MAAKACGVRWFGLVSSAGASPTSHFLYLRTKGETENDLAALDLPHLSIFRPGYLKCARVESRPMERIIGWFMPFSNFLTGERSAIPTETVAKCMILDAMETACADAKGEPPSAVKIIDNKAMIDSVKLSEHA